MSMFQPLLPMLASSTVFAIIGGAVAAALILITIHEKLK